MRIILLLKGNFDKFWKMHVQAERLYFLFLFCARHYPWWSLWQKNTKNNLFIQVNPHFSVVEFCNTVTFWRNARFNVILTSVTIIKLGFLRKLFCNESLVDIEVSKHLNILSLTRLIALVVVTSSLTSTPWRQLIKYFLYKNKRRIYGFLKWNHKTSVLISSLQRIIRILTNLKKVLKPTFFKPWSAGNQNSKTLKKLWN